MIGVKKKNIKMIQNTPGDYILALEEVEDKQLILREIREAVDQIRTFEKRQNDIRFICYRDFQMDDSLTRTNMVVDGMVKRFYDTVDNMTQCVRMPEMENRSQEMQELIRCNDTIIADLFSLITFLLKVQTEGENRSLSEIEDVIDTMEEEYINELTKM